MAMRSAVAWPNGKAYLFFDDNTYSRYDMATGRLEEARVAVVPRWPGLVGSPKPFVWWGFGKAYAFTGPTYARYEDGTNGPEGVEAAYLPPNVPFTIAAQWAGMPLTWLAGIDAGVNWGTGKLYFFRGGEYVRYDVPTDRVDPTYPKQISGNWPGLFTDRIDAALYPGGRHAYFFRDEEYRRYDVDAERVDFSGRLASFALDPTPGGGVTPARMLTAGQAAAIVADLVARGRVSISGPAAPAPGAHLVLNPATIDGTRLTNMANPAAGITDNVDQRMVVVLDRLIAWLNASEPAVSELLHMGIGHGVGPPNDCHNQGRALDLAGLSGTSQGAPFKKMIDADWGSLPARAGSAVRIDPSVDALAHRLFLTAYTFGSYECESNAIGALNRYSPPSLGGAGFVIYPDYGGDATLRAQHRNHIHMQIGPTKA
ncbi:MAG TPA: hemopexin repeat-containing protein [Candidatus Acidoferrum sp.]|nr:hemopexin repeat-containing protein [Candidatus Acidoferrum sp.]